MIIAHVLEQQLTDIVARTHLRGTAAQVESILLATWLDDYAINRPIDGVVKVQARGFHYLFDVALERLIAAWGVSVGAVHEPRPGSRMSGFPLSAGTLYHRGHAIAHQLGGGTDINLVPQRGSINIGAFRELERQAVREPGTLYFSYWIYATNGSDIPVSVLQGVIPPDGKVRVMSHPN